MCDSPALAINIAEPGRMVVVVVVAVVVQSSWQDARELSGRLGAEGEKAIRVY